MTPNHTDRDHAEFSPSSLKYVAACAGYEGRGETSAASEKGTRIHEALEIRDPSALHDEEELEIYEKIVTMEEEFMGNFGNIAQEFNEIQVTVKLDGTETWGTCDRFLILESGNAVMADYKTGISIIDPPEKNWQAKAYVLGAFQMYPEIEEITFVFYVPQFDACLHHTFRRSDVDQLTLDLSRVIKAGEATRPKWEKATIDIDDCTPSQYCRFCKHEDHCPALGGLVLNVAKQLSPTVTSIDVSNTDDPQNLSELFRIAKIVENWAANIKAKTVEVAKDGIQLDGLKLRSMGKSKSISDNYTFLKVAANFGLATDDLLDSAKFSLSKAAKLASAGAEKKEKREIENNFVDACRDAGIVSESDERFTVVEQ